MMKPYRSLVLIVPCLAVVGCNDGLKSAAEFQMDQQNAMRLYYYDSFMYMTDNAILSDMALSDYHFIPHTDEISGVGEQRLARMATLLNTYGGTVRYQTRLGDEDLVQRRLEHAKEYLALAGCDMDRVELAVAAPGGYGMPGDEAVGKYYRGTAVDDADVPAARRMPGDQSRQAGQRERIIGQ